ncbi:hypothetical protein Q3G72_009536 [Acer saccharum]|nr:hypothetical protein Q3G72_009536 [Acer saccharum]
MLFPYCFSLLPFIVVNFIASFSSQLQLLQKTQSSQIEIAQSSLSLSLSLRASSASSEPSVATLLDYGAGNVRSVRNAIRHLGFDIKDATHSILIICTRL